MNEFTLAQIKDIGLPASAVIMMLITAAFMIRWTAQQQAKAQKTAEDAQEDVRKVIKEQQDRNDELQKSFTQQLIAEQVAGKQREADQLKQLTQTNQRVVELQLEIGQIRLEQKQSLAMVDVLTKERDKKSADYEAESQARVRLEARVSSLESDLEKSKKERRELSEKYTQLKKEHDALASERNKLAADMAALKRQTQTITKVE
mgnify:FL=1